MLAFLLQNTSCIHGWDVGASLLNDQVRSSDCWLRAVFHHPSCFLPQVYSGVWPFLDSEHSYTHIFFPRLLFPPPFHLWTPTNPLCLSVEILPFPSPSWPSKLKLGAHPNYPLNILYFTNPSVTECLLRCFLPLTWKLSEDGKNTYFATFVFLLPRTVSRYLTGDQSVFWVNEMNEWCILYISLHEVEANLCLINSQWICI